MARLSLSKSSATVDYVGGVHFSGRGLLLRFVFLAADAGSHILSGHS